MTKEEIVSYLVTRGIFDLLNEESIRQNRFSIYYYLDEHQDENFVNIIDKLITWSLSERGREFWFYENEKLHEFCKTNCTKEKLCTPIFKVSQVVIIHINNNFNYFTNNMCDYDNKKVTIKQVFINDHTPNNDDGCLYYIEEDNQQFVWTSQYFS